MTIIISLCGECYVRTHLHPLVPGTNAELIDLRLCHVSAFLSGVKLVLELPVLGLVGVYVLLLVKRKRGGGMLSSWQGY